MDSDSLGKPKEGCGASNGAEGGVSGGPSWGDAKFKVEPCTFYEIRIKIWTGNSSKEVL